MSYSYEAEKPKLFTLDGVRLLWNIQRAADNLLPMAGAAMAENLWADVSGTYDTWTLIAALDFLVEKQVLVEIPQPEGTFAQHRIFVKGPKL